MSTVPSEDSPQIFYGVAMAPRDGFPAAGPTISTGTMVVFSDGDYEDYTIIGLFCVVRDIPQDIAKQYMVMIQNDDRKETVRKSFEGGKGCVQWLIGQGYISPVLYRELYIEMDGCDGKYAGIRYEPIEPLLGDGSL